MLPFANMSGDPEQEYFADGMTEDLITDLSKVSGLSVIARNSVFTYKGKAADVQEVSRRFSVATVLEGSVRKAGQRVRINAQLIDGKDGTHLWADRYDRDLTDIFALQDEITKTIVEQLKVRLLPAEKQAIEAAPTQNIDAYNYYLQGRHFYHLHSTPHALIAQRLFRKAVELDPLYARAYSGLADCAWSLLTNHHEGVERRRDHGGEHDRAAVWTRRSRKLMPRMASRCILQAGGTRPRRSSTRRSSSIRTCTRPSISPLTRAATAAIRKAQRACTRERPSLPPTISARRCCGRWILRDLGRPSEFRAAALIGVERAERALKAHPDIPLAASLGAATLAALGERARALDWAERAMTIAPDDPLTHFNVACTYALLGEPEKAIDLLERWTARVNKVTQRWLVNDTDFNNIRDHPRFKALLRPFQQAR